MKVSLVRGLPGSGKSTYAKELANGAFHIEADMWWMRDGKYQFNGADVPRNHAWCLSMFENALNNGLDVVVSNTFTQLWEMEAYLDYAKKLGVSVDVYRCTADYGNVHDVPAEVLVKMREGFEDYEGETLVG